MCRHIENHIIFNVVAMAWKHISMSNGLIQMHAVISVCESNIIPEQRVPDTVHSTIMEF